MATQSAASQGGSGDEKPLRERLELSPPVGGISQTEATEGTQQKLPFITSEPIREDQVQNAVKFLSHPKVRGSPVVYRRSFLERKGLTKDEIDEAFLRVPDPPPNATPADSGATNQAPQPRTSTILQPQAPIQPPQPAAAQAGAVSLVPTLQQRRFNWSYALIAIGVLSASGAGTAVLFKKVVLPRLKAWIRRVAAEGNVSEKEVKSSKSLAEETAEAAKAAASAAAIVATASQELLNSKNEDRKYIEAFMGMIDVQVKEMKSMSEAIHKLGKEREQDRLIQEYVQSATANGTTNNSWGTSHVFQTDTTPNIMSMFQRGERPRHIREINDMPQNPNQSLSGTLAAARTKPWEFSQQSSGTESQQNGLSQDVLSDSRWRNKSVKITELEPEREERSRRFPYSTGASEKPSSQRVWVPPQPPSVVIPEAAAAIRHPKSSLPIQKQHSGDEKIMAHSHESDGVSAGTSNSVDIETYSTSSVGPNNSEMAEETANDIEVI